MPVKVTSPLLAAAALAALVVAAGAAGVLYVPHVIAHAQTPLVTRASTSAPQCAIVCVAHADCEKWSLTDSVCHLWPRHGDDNQLTAFDERLFQRTLPPDFTLSSDPTIAYSQHAYSVQGDNVTMIAGCRRLDPDALPAVPRTQAQFDYLKSFVTCGYCLVGVWNKQAGAVFRDMISGEVLPVVAGLFWNGVIPTSITEDCMTIYGSGLYAVSCDSYQSGIVCEYHVQENGRRPLN